MASFQNANFLVVGGGSIGKRHIKNLQSIGFGNIFCLKRSPDPDFEKDLHVKVTTDFRDLKEPIAAVIICTPTSLHNEGLRIAKALGAAVLMEKPLIHSHEGMLEAATIMEGVEQPFFLGFMLRFHPLVKKIKQLLDDHYIGNIYSARFEFGSFLPNWHPWEDHRISYASRKELGGGVINTITHELDLIQFFFGSPQAVYCTRRNLGKLDIEVEEIAEAAFDYQDKVVTLHLDYLQKEYDRNIKILGDEGKITWNWHDNKLTVKKNGQPPEEFQCPVTFEVNQLYIDELQEFIRLIQNKTQQHPLNFHHALENTKLMLKMHESAALKRQVNLI